MHRKECELIRFVLFLLFVCFSSVKWLFDSSSFQNWSAKCWPEGSFQHYGRNYQIQSKKYEAFLTNKSTKILFVVYKKFPRYNLVSFSTQKNYFHCGIESFYTNCMRAIIRRGLYLFYLIFHCSLYCRAVSITDNLCTKHGNSFILVLKICGFLSRAVSNQERVIMARVR